MKNAVLKLSSTRQNLSHNLVPMFSPEIPNVYIEMHPFRESNEAAASFRARLRERAAAEEEELRLRWVAQMEERERLEQMGDAKRRMKKLVRDHLDLKQSPIPKRC